jgi:glycosyltransferase involved in cell wall biosynthesis
MTVLVTHPGRQHSHRAAWALERAGLLAAYWSGVPATNGQLQRLPGFIRQRLRYEPIDLPERLCRWFPATPALRRLAERTMPRDLTSWVDYYACRRFDRQVARRLRRTGAGAVLACEISARDTFRAASTMGLPTILDAPSLHHAAQDRLHGTADSARLHAAILAVKDEEIRQAAHIVTVSHLARESYLEAGVPPGRVHAVTLGADLDLFTPPERREPPPVRFVFAGATIRRKGFDTLIEACVRLAASGTPFSLRLVGPVTDDGWRSRPWASAAGSVPQRELAREFRSAHCLVLPSRNDSYGMVVAEALATGMPAIVSDMVGAKDLVVPGRTGWVVPHGDANALAERLLKCATSPDMLAAMAPACREVALTATWDAYAERFVALCRQIVEMPA